MPTSTKFDKITSQQEKLLLLQTAKQVIKTEQKAISRLLDSIDESFIDACELLINCRGKIVITAIGKSGHIGGKLAASFSSLGSPAIFMHAAEALHGDIGMITKDDVVILLSYSGSSHELLNLLPSLKNLNIPLIAITGNDNSPIAKAANLHLPIFIDEEACHLNLAPTASTTATLVLGDALTIAVTKAKQITKEDFARAHPGGNLGRKLLLKVSDIMATGDKLAIATKDTDLTEALITMTNKGLGMLAIVNNNIGNNQDIIGIFTDGDLRRYFEQSHVIAKIKIGDIMNTHCTTVDQNTLAINAWQLMRDNKINGLLITDTHSNKLVGMINVHTLAAANII